MGRDQYQKRREWVSYLSYEEIDTQQVVRLDSILAKWQERSMKPWNVLYETDRVVGANAFCLIPYGVSMELLGEINDGTFYDDFCGEVTRETLREAKKSIISKLRKEGGHLKKIMRPEVLQHTNEVSAAIQDIRSKLEDSLFDSWETARAIAEVIIDSEADGSMVQFTGNPLRNFIEGIEREKRECEKRKVDTERTLAFFMPETEKEIKNPLSRMWAKERAYKQWKEKQASEGREFFLSEIAFENAGCPGAPKDDESVEFMPPIEYPEKPLCDGMEIVPSGTGLIEIEEPEDSLNIYGVPVARITTYSVSFVCRDEADIQELREIVEKALDVLGNTPYRYSLPGHTSSGKSYTRIRSTKDGYQKYGTVVSPYVKVENGRVQPEARFDLDDLWILYFLLEPVISSNAQIANAMNMARYVEERGAILAPDPIDYASTGQHHLKDKSGYMSGDDPEDILPEAIRDILSDLALKKIDEVEFEIRIRILAHLVRNGTIPHPKYEILALPSGEEGNKGKMMPRENITVVTAQIILCQLAGLPQKSQASQVSLAISELIREIEEPLRGAHRRKDQEDSERIQQKRKERRRQFEAESARKSFAEMLLTEDVKQLLSQKGAKSDSKSSSSMTRRGDLVGFSDEVETCIDGMHAEGKYRSKTRGSPFVRKELPKSLQPFCSEYGDEERNLLEIISFGKH